MSSYQEATEKEKLNKLNNEEVKRGMSLLLKLSIVGWIVNLIWLMALLWISQYFIIEQDMKWMEEPRHYCIIVASITKMFMTLFILNSLSYFKYIEANA